ncbi:MAG TPA: methyltransferase, TIGR04325 family [Kiritimatiellia bacterium]|nr:methyltransferase, TIGR04325 family [Kiritimatiellia bacterium]
MKQLTLLATVIRDRLMPSRNNRYVGDFASWEEACRCCPQGYDAGVIFEKVRAATREVVAGRAAFERDSVLFQKPEYNWPLLTMLFRQQAAMPGRVTVLDFGGALGSAYHQHRKWIKDLPGLRWCVVEQAHFVTCGKNEFETDSLKFYYTLDECLMAEQVTLALFSSVLPYLPDPWSPLAAVSAAEVPCVMIDRTHVFDEKGSKCRIAIQHVPAAIYHATYPVRIFQFDQFVSALGPKYHMTTVLVSDETFILYNPWQVGSYRGGIYEISREQID